MSSPANLPVSTTSFEQQTARDTSIDVARGIAIIAIVLGHVDRGLVSAGIISADSAWAIWSDHFLYSWHLSIFALLSGLFLPRTRDRLSFGGFLRRRVLEWLYLYALWSILQGTVRALAGDAANDAAPISELWQLWRPDGQLWFLPWLIIAALIGAALRPWAHARVATGSIAASAALAWFTWGTDGGIIGTQGLALIVCYLVGATIGAPRATAFIRDRSRTALMCAAIVGVGTAAALACLGLPTPTAYGTGATPLTATLGIVATISGTLGVLACSALVSRVRPAALLAALLAAAGRNSLAIFLAHIIAAAGVRAMLMRLGFENPGVHSVIGTAVGVLIPLLLIRLAPRVHAGWLFALPQPATARRNRGAQPQS